MAKETRKRFLRSTVADDIQDALNAVAEARAAMGDGIDISLEKGLSILFLGNTFIAQYVG